MLQTLCVAERKEDKLQSVEKCWVDVLFNLSELDNVESIEDHLYICPTFTPTATTNVRTRSAFKARTK